jgi:hypothetical protein
LIAFVGMQHLTCAHAFQFFWARARRTPRAGRGGEARRGGDTRLQEITHAHARATHADTLRVRATSSRHRCAQTHVRASVVATHRARHRTQTRVARTRRIRATHDLRHQVARIQSIALHATNGHAHVLAKQNVEQRTPGKRNQRHARNHAHQTLSAQQIATVTHAVRRTHAEIATRNTHTQTTRTHVHKNTHPRIRVRARQRQHTNTTKRMHTSNQRLDTHIPLVTRNQSTQRKTNWRRNGNVTCSSSFITCYIIHCVSYCIFSR